MGINMENIMIIVPHEDDEVLMAGGIIERAVKNGKKVTVVIATNGDYEGTDMETGSIRLPETAAGLAVLGLPLENIIFMGYADTGMNAEESFLYSLYYEKEESRIHKGHCADVTYGMKSKQDFHSEYYGRAGEYTRKNFKEDLRTIFMLNKPDTIFTTSLEDIHGDHSGLYLFVLEVLKEEKANGYVPVLYSGVVHSKAGDHIWPERSEEMVPFSCPPDFDKGSLKWEDRVSFPVPESMRSMELDRNKKAEALSKHVHALKEDAMEYLYAFIKADEVFWEIKEK
ncbi:hypothetical protein IMSAG249_01207 [Lachnospiraceae bacterium]|nr:hypothetical protein IMSAG249_01207 [Lachnospiraceae bacterium]